MVHSHSLSNRPTLPVLSGTTIAIFMILLLTVVFPVYNYGPTSIGELAWFSLGIFINISISVHLFQRYNIISSFIISLGSFLIAVTMTWLRIFEAAQAGAALSAGPTILYLYLFFWLITLIVSLFTGGLEGILRHGWSASQ